MSEPIQPRRTQLPVVQPSATTHRASTLTVGAAAIAMASVVAVVLYGITRVPQQQTASAPAAASQTTPQPAETTGAARATDEASAPAQPSGGGNERATTGQGGTAAGNAADANNAAG